ncbi:MAG: class I SAM-dependent methyltransferase [Acidimicrobiales bacterium]
MAAPDPGREQRLVFGEVAPTYDEARPGYPGPAVDDIVAFAHVGAGDRVLEVGAGTGKATVALGARGLSVVALEPSPAMAALCSRNVAPYGGVTVVVSGFEEWPGEQASFRLLVAAQSWHWMPAGTRYARAHELLVPGGTLALLWNRPVWPETELRSALSAVYRAQAPALWARDPGFPGLTPRPDEAWPAQIAATELFGDVEAHAHPWSETYTTERYVRLLSTQSDHRMLPATELDALLGSVADVLDAAGGGISVDYMARLYLARSRPPARAVPP